MFCHEGLRTLLTAKTERSEEQYLEWLSDFQAAETSMEGREEKVQHTSLEILFFSSVKSKSCL